MKEKIPGTTAMAGLAAILLLGAASSVGAQDAGFVQGFGSLRIESEPARSNATFGGVIGGNITPNIQAIGEAGRIGNVLPSMTTSLVGFSPVGFGVSAWYGQAGLRVTSRRSAVRPYVEVAGGLARLQARTAFTSGRFDTIADAALGFLDRTEPMASVGGGITLGGGPIVADIGYRYRRVFGSDWINTLALGDTLHTSDVRIGLGVRF